MEFLDTNVILRYLTKDDPAKAERCFELFQRVKEKEIRLTTSESVLAEVIYVLSSRSLYNLPRENIRALLLPIIRLTALKVPHRRAVIHALNLYATSNLDFEDALSLAHMRRQKISRIVSYDEDFDRFEDIERREP